MAIAWQVRQGGEVYEVTLEAPGGLRVVRFRRQSDGWQGAYRLKPEERFPLDQDDVARAELIGILMRLLPAGGQVAAQLEREAAP